MTTLYISLISFTVILITVPAAAPTHADAKFVFTNFVNSTGWASDGLAFIVGLINPNWVFACLDSATHMAEEVGRPEKAIPIAILGTVAIGFTTSWFYVIAMFFSLSDLEPLLNTPTGVPILELYYQALGNKAGAIVLESLVLVTGIGCQIASHTWQSRLCWSFARDRGLPGHKWLSKVHPVLDVPWIAHTVSCAIVSVLGLLYLGSSTAFNSMVTACIVLLYISYAIPIICLLYKGRNNIQHGPFWLGPFGLVANIVVLAWTLFTLVMYSFPSVYPVTAGCKYSCSGPLSVLLFLGLYHSDELHLRCLWRGRGYYFGRLVSSRQALLPRSAVSPRGSNCNSGAFGGSGAVMTWIELPLDAFCGYTLDFARST